MAEPSHFGFIFSRYLSASILARAATTSFSAWHWISLNSWIRRWASLKFSSSSGKEILKCTITNLNDSQVKDSPWGLQMLLQVTKLPFLCSALLTFHQNSFVLCYKVVYLLLNITNWKFRTRSIWWRLCSSNHPRLGSALVHATVFILFTIHIFTLFTC